MLQDDFIKRLIEALGAALARVAGLRAEGRNDEALKEVVKGYATLGFNPHLISSLNGTSLRVLSGSAERAEALAKLLKIEAELKDVSGEHSIAKQRRRQYLALQKSLSTDTNETMTKL